MAASSTAWLAAFPPGWGEPVFDRLEADLAKAMLSLPASKGFDIGSGFGGILLTGTQHNDPFRARSGKVYTTSNRSGGIQGGISNGQTIYFRVAFKPVATVMREQDTVDVQFKNTTLKARGRHDPCVLPRAVPIVEAMTALVLVDHALRHKAQCGPAGGLGAGAFGLRRLHLDVQVAQLRADTAEGDSVIRQTPLAVFGKAITSRMLGVPQRIAFNRSKPRAMPPCGGAP